MVGGGLTSTTTFYADHKGTNIGVTGPVGTTAVTLEVFSPNGTYTAYGQSDKRYSLFECQYFLKGTITLTLTVSTAGTYTVEFYPR